MQAESGALTTRELLKCVDHASIKVTELYAYEKQGKAPSIGLE